MSDEKVLSQAMIDALVSQVPVKPRVPRVEAKSTAAKAPETVKTEPPPPATAAVPVYSSVSQQGEVKAAAAPSSSSPEEIEYLKKKVDDLARQMTKTLGLVQRLDIIEETMERQKALFALQKKHTWNPRESFQCDSCNSSHLVALYVKCTSCGKETWIGWWPKE